MDEENIDDPTAEWKRQGIKNKADFRFAHQRLMALCIKGIENCSNVMYVIVFCDSCKFHVNFETVQEQVHRTALLTNYNTITFNNRYRNILTKVTFSL